jgi:hypothetical protein
MKPSLAVVAFIPIILAGLFLFWQPVSANQDGIYPAESGTIELGKQGLFIKYLPSAIKFVEIERIRSLKYKYTIDVEITYRRPALEITFLNKYKSAGKPTPTQSSVYFNISEPEVKLWEEGGSSEIGIWYYNKKSKKWQPCYTRFVPEKVNNGKYDRLACMVMGNGIYVLGKMEFDPSFTEWFRPHDLSRKTFEDLMVLME